MGKRKGKRTDVWNCRLVTEKKKTEEESTWKWNGEAGKIRFIWEQSVWQ